MVRGVRRGRGRGEQATALWLWKMGEQHLAVRRGVQRRLFADPVDIDDDVGRRDLVDVDHLVSLEDGEVDRFAGAQGELFEHRAGGAARSTSATTEPASRTNP